MVDRVQREVRGFPLEIDILKVGGKVKPNTGQ